MARTTSIWGRLELHDAIDVLRKEGVITSVTASNYQDAVDNRTIRFMVEVDVEEVVSEARTSTLENELTQRSDFDPFPSFSTYDVAEGLRYAMTGQAVLAEAMFARAMPDHDLSPLIAAMRH